MVIRNLANTNSIILKVMNGIYPIIYIIPPKVGREGFYSFFEIISDGS